jgi:hypothetical protein
MELPDTDEPEGAALRERLCERASEAREKLRSKPDRLEISEYLCIRRPGESLFVASVNLGGGRKPPSMNDFRALNSEREFESLMNHWFRPEGLRDKFVVKGTSDLRTSASRGWSQGSAQEEKPKTGWKPLGTTRADIEVEVETEWARLLRERCKSKVCWHLDDDEENHGLGQDDVLEMGREAMRIVNDRHDGEDPFGEREPVLTIIP